MPKILVINGHGEKTGQKVKVVGKHSIITPGNAENSYTIDFDEEERHLEEMTSQNKIWPITDEHGNAMQWHRYRDTTVDEIAIDPLQSSFSFSVFAIHLLTGKITWGNLSNPPHDVVERGALAVRRLNNEIVILEGIQLKNFLQQVLTGGNIGAPIFFCDKEIGKIKPMGATSLSEIYAAVDLINEFKTEGTQIIVATCSPTQTGEYKDIRVQTKQPGLAIEQTVVDTFPEQPKPKNSSEPKESEKFLLKDNNSSTATTTTNTTISKPQTTENSSSPDYDSYINKIQTLISNPAFLKGKIIHIRTGVIGNFFQPNARPPVLDRIKNKVNLYNDKSASVLFTIIKCEAINTLAEAIKEQTHDSHSETIKFLKALTNIQLFNHYYDDLIKSTTGLCTSN